MDSSISPYLVKMIGNKDKAYQEGLNRLTLANEQKIKELEMKRDQHLRMAEECMKERNEVYEELARRGVALNPLEKSNTDFH